MNRILPLLALPLLSILAVSSACKSSSDNNDNPDGGDSSSSSSSGDVGGEGGTPGPGDPTVNPIEGQAEAVPFADTSETKILPSFLDGAAWSVAQNSLFFSAPESPEGFVLRFTSDGKGGVTRKAEAPMRTVGMTIDPSNGDLISVTEKSVHRMPIGANKVADPATNVVVTSAYDPATNPPSTDEFDPTKVAPPGNGTFDALNDIVVSKTGHMYFTDPGYKADLIPEANRVFWLPAGQTVAKIIGAYENNDRPNGIALSPDEKSLYVSYTTPFEAKPFVGKFTVADDGSIDNKVAPQKFVPDTGDGSTPDGLACDTAGNVYVATAQAVLVYKATGEQWGTVSVKAPGFTVTGMTFGGPDLKTLYITTGGPADVAKVFTIQTKVAGLPY